MRFKDAMHAVERQVIRMAMDETARPRSISIFRLLRFIDKIGVHLNARK